MRLTTPKPPESEAGVHPGRDWFTVLSGTAELRLGDRLIRVETGSAAEFSTMVPLAIGAADGRAVEVLTILMAAGEHAHVAP